MASNLVQITRRGFGETTRRDLWWLPSLATFLGFSAFIVYSTCAAFQGEHYRFGPYLSPFYSPELLGSATAWFGPKPGWIPTWIPFTAALLILAGCASALRAFPPLRGKVPHARAKVIKLLTAFGLTARLLGPGTRQP